MNRNTRMSVAALTASAAFAGHAAGAAANFTPAASTGHAIAPVAALRLQLTANRYVECSGLSGGASVNALGTVLDEAPTFTGCQMYLGILKPAVASNTQTFAYTSVGAAGAAMATGAQRFQYGSCVWTLTAAAASTPVTITNVGPDVVVTTSASGVAYTTTGCAAFGVPAVGTTATLTWAAKASGVNGV